MEGLSPLLNGFMNSLSLVNLVACFTGALVGTIIGVLPGLGPTVTLALMLPFTFKFGPTAGLIMMAGVWYGAMYGGSTTSILVNIPGEAASVVTCIDGYQMCKKGRAGAALALVAIGSVVAGTIGIVGLQFFAPLLGRAALAFGPPEYLAVMILAFVVLSNLSGEYPVKGAAMTFLGLFVSSIGMNPLDSYPRFTFGSETLVMGIDFLPLAMGLFGVSEILNIVLEKHPDQEYRKIRFRELYPTREETKRSVGPILRGSVLGFFVGLLPGPCNVLSTFISYAVEKKISKTPDEFGKGAVEGVVAPESANNSAVMGAMIPLLTLGIPFAAPSAVMLAGLRMHNIDPGPMLFTNTPEMFWTFIAAMYIGNLMLLILNLPLVGLFARIAIIRPAIIMPPISLICLIGVYSVRNSMFDVWIMIISGLIGYFLRNWKFPIAPFIIGVVLAPTMENSVRQSLMLFKGNPLLIVGRPVAMTLLAVAIAFILYRIVSSLMGKKVEFKGEEPA